MEAWNQVCGMTVMQQSTEHQWILGIECVYVCLQRVLLFPLTSSCTTFEWLLDPMARLPGALMRPTSRGLRGSCCHANGAEQNAACQDVVCPSGPRGFECTCSSFQLSADWRTFAYVYIFQFWLFYFYFIFLSSVFWHSTESGERLANSATPFRVFFFLNRSSHRWAIIIFY